MKLVHTCSLLLAGIYGCQRICGDLGTGAGSLPRGESGASGAADQLGMTAGEGGVPVIPPTSTPGGMTNEVSGGAGGESGAPAGGTCAPPPTSDIIDFEGSPPRQSPLGVMASDTGRPDDMIVGDSPNQRYQETGTLPAQSDQGFTFTFDSCVDPSAYAGIRFNALGATPAGVDVLLFEPGASEPTNKDHFGPTAPGEFCVPFVNDQKTLLKVRFQYSGFPMTTEVNLTVDDLAFYVDGECTGM